MHRITFVIGNRAHYARIKPIINHLSQSDYRIIFFEAAALKEYGDVMSDSNLKPSDRSVVYTSVSGSNLLTMTKSAGLSVIELANDFSVNKPKIVVVVADRYEALSAAVAARYMNIPLAHIQGGEVTGSIDDSIRNSITKLANLHFVSNDDSFERVKKMGEDPETIFVTGCPTIDLCKNISKRRVNKLFKRYTGKYEKKFSLEKKYIIVSFHPVTTEYKENSRHFRILLKAVNSLDVQTIWLYPNLDAGSDLIKNEIQRFKESDRKNNIHFFRHFEIEDYLSLMKDAKCIIGNSSVGIREASFLGTPSVNIGSRQSGRLRANNVFDCVNITEKDIVSAIKTQVLHGQYPKNELYGDGESGVRIARVLKETNIGIEKKITY